MSDKPLRDLWPTDRELRSLFPAGIKDGTEVTIRLVCGFERFNTRPYHNYETWSNGWYIETHDGIKVCAEDLDVAVGKLKDAMLAQHGETR